MSNRRSVRRRIWWATWPGALALGAVSLVMVVVTAIPLIATATSSATDVAGTDLTASGGLGTAWRIAYVVLGLLFLAVPIAVVKVARRKWLGWVLIFFLASAVILGAGLWALRII